MVAERRPMTPYVNLRSTLSEGPPGFKTEILATRGFRLKRSPWRAATWPMKFQAHMVLNAAVVELG